VGNFYFKSVGLSNIFYGFARVRMAVWPPLFWGEDRIEIALELMLAAKEA